MNALYRRKKRQRSDVLTVCLFFHRFLGDRNWAVNTIRSVLAGTAAGVLGVVEDPFADWFPRLREGRSADPAGHAEELYRDMLGRLFHARSGGGLEMRSIRGADGEIAIRAQTAERDFGVIYVGDRNKLVGRAEQVAPELVGPRTGGRRVALRHDQRARFAGRGS